MSPDLGPVSGAGESTMQQDVASPLPSSGSQDIGDDGSPWIRAGAPSWAPLLFSALFVAVLVGLILLSATRGNREHDDSQLPQRSPTATPIGSPAVG